MLPNITKRDAILRVTKEICKFFFMYPDSPLVDVVLTYKDEDKDSYTDEELMHEADIAWNYLTAFLKITNALDFDDIFGCYRCLQRRYWELKNNGTDGAPRLMYENPPYKRMYFNDWKEST